MHLINVEEWSMLFGTGSQLNKGVAYIPGQNLTAAIRLFTSRSQAPKLFAGLRFCLSAYMDPDGRHRVRHLIAAAGGQVLRGGFLDLLLGYSDGSSVGPYFVFDGDAPGEFFRSTLRKEEVEARKHAAAGARVISHLRVLDAVAAYDADILDR